MAINGYRFLLQRVGGSVIDTYAEYGIVILDMPAYFELKAKNISSQSYFDESGDDEYMPATLTYEPAECELQFECKVTSGSPFTNLSNFTSYLAGGVFSFYSEFLGIGRGNARLAEVDDDAEYKEQDVLRNGVLVTEKILRFKIKIKINTPQINVVLSL
jgi:hypothetical protein